MVDNFPSCAAFTYAWEGGYSFVPNDPGNWTGGALNVGSLAGTNLGVSAPVWAAWTHAAVTPAIMRALTRADTDPLYMAWYWLPVRGPELPLPIALMVYDFAVNAGVRESIRELETALGTPPDGMIGPNDLAAVATLTDMQAALQAIFTAHDAHYRANASFGIFGAGWENRLRACLTQSKHWAAMTAASVGC